MSTATVLIIDDDTDYAQQVAAILSPDFQVRFASSGEEGIGAIEADPPDAVLLDLYLLGGRNGLEVLEQIRAVAPGLPVVMATDHPSEDTAAEALARGALYYLAKVAGRAEILAKLRICLDVAETSRRKQQLESELKEVHGIFLASSPAMTQLSGKLDRIAAAGGTTVLVLGESGSGKDQIAREIHLRSPRSKGPFVKMSTVSDEVADSELFGHVRGSFTGASSDRQGYFESARGGTLFLSEIGDLSPKVQVKLLRAIEEKRIVRVGETLARPVDVRVIAATNRDLEAMVRDGDFRADLLGRLSVITVQVPPLRERPEDVGALARYFAGRAAAEQGLRQVTLTEDAIRKLVSYSWRRNNVRELRSCIERAIVLYGPDGVIDAGSLDIPVETQRPEGFDYHQEKDRAEAAFQRRFLARAFAQVGGSIEHPTPSAINRVCTLTSLPPQTVRRLIRGLRDGGLLPPDAFGPELEAGEAGGD